MSNNVRWVLIRAERLEKILKNEFGAEGKGLGDYAHDLRDKGKLAPGAFEKLKYISKVRNQAAHEPSTFKIEDPERFVQACNEVQAMLGFSSGFDITRLNIGSISLLSYVGVLMAFSVQLARANAWDIPIFKSYEHAFITSFFLVACGIAHTAYIWQNYYVSLGLLLSTIGGFAWMYKWVLPIIPSHNINLYIGITTAGILLSLYGVVPQLLGIICRVCGFSILIVEVWLALTQGLDAVHYINLLIAPVLIGLSVLMFRHHNKLRENGAFRNRRAKVY